MQRVHGGRWFVRKCDKETLVRHKLRYEPNVARMDEKDWEATMKSKPQAASGEKSKPREDEANLGQKEAQAEKKSETEMK
jgi:hypothetical protein